MKMTMLKKMFRHPPAEDDKFFATRLGTESVDQLLGYGHKMAYLVTEDWRDGWGGEEWARGGLD